MSRVIAGRLGIATLVLAGGAERAPAHATGTEKQDVDVTVVVTALGGDESEQDGGGVETVVDEQLPNDGRENLVSSAYIGTAIDNFAGSEVLTYLNPQEAGPTEQRLIFGFNFDFRLTGDRERRITPRNAQLWLYGETLHGVRSRDVECPTAGESLAVCADIRNKGLFPTLENLPERAAFILKNASSFEGYLGLRWEFLGIRQAGSNGPTDTAAALYLKAQAGLLAITPNKAQTGAAEVGAGSDSVDNHLVAIGVIATNGPMAGSYVDVGYGRTDLFFDRSHRRWKFDAVLSFCVVKCRFSPFAQIVVDSDFGDGSDSIQSFLGIDFDVAELLGW